VTEAKSAGYLHHSYAASLSEFGTPRHLPRSDGWILERAIPWTGAVDAMGPYPVFACRNWAALGDDLEEIGTGLVSLALVADPFGNYDLEALRRCFPDRLVPFKRHFVTDFAKVGPQTVSKHHRYYARRALAAVEVDALEGEAAAAFAGIWSSLYETLVARHRLTGIKAFSCASFEKQLGVPGTVVLRARERGEVVGAHIWYLQDRTAFSHLAAVNARGYELMAPYALYSFALDHFKGRASLLDLGAGAGASGDAQDGLTRFKRGWATGDVPVYFCGRIFDREGYEQAARARSASAEEPYFPIYRSGELG
jgi:hypothetical protein